MKRLPNLGMMGKMGSGKGYASKYLAKRHRYKIIGMGNIVRAVARKERMKPTRENLEKLQKKYSKNGNDFVIEKLNEKITSIRRPIILDGIRKPNQARFAKEKLGAVLIEVYTDQKIRFERMKKRGRAGFPKTFEEFKKVEGKEEKVFHMNKALKMADFRISNDDGVKRFYRDLELLMKKVIK